MKFCQECGSSDLRTIPGHGCGGMGAITGCLTCDRSWEQVDGGPLAYNFSWSERDGSFVETLYNEIVAAPVVEIRNTWRVSCPAIEDFDSTFATKESAEAHKADLIKIWRNKLPWPVCTSCKQDKMTKKYPGWFVCEKCGFESCRTDSRE